MKSHYELENDMNHLLSNTNLDDAGISPQNKKSSLTLDFRQTTKNSTCLRKLKFCNGLDAISARGNCQNRPGSLEPSGDNDIVSNATDDFVPVVLTSPDVEMVKLSTPDLDNYLLQLQRELSTDFVKPSENDLSTSGIENLCLDTPHTIGQFENVVKEEFTGPSLPEILDSAEKVSTELQFNSFDSGFSDTSIKTDIENELYEHISKNYQNWHGCNEHKIANFISKCGDVIRDTNCHNSEKHNFWTCSNIHIETKNESRLNKLRLLNFINGHQEHKQDNRSINKANCYDQERNKPNNNNSRRSICYNNSSCNLSDKPSKKGLLEFTFSSLDSNSGGFCCDHSSPFDDGIRATRAMRAAIHSNSRGFLDLPSQFSDSPTSVDPPDEGLALTRNSMTVQEKRKLFKRQDAEMEMDCQSGGFQFFQFIAGHGCDVLPREPQQDVGFIGRARSSPSDRVEFESFGQEFLKLQRKRAKNRLAATRCRNKKLERINFLRREVDFLKLLNAKYNDRLVRLRKEVDRLQSHVTNHVIMGCDLSCLLVDLR